MPQLRKISKNNTAVVHNADTTTVILHGTPIVTITPEHIVLNTGGFNTATTRNRMNQVSNQLNLGYKVYIRSGYTFVDFKGKTYSFDNYLVKLLRT